MQVHAALEFGWLVISQPHLSKSSPHEQPIGTSHLSRKTLPHRDPVSLLSPPSVELERVREKMPELTRHRALLDAVAGLEFRYPAERFAGRGIVICGGGVKYFPCVYVLVRLLRLLECRLPIEVWHLGEQEMSQDMRGLLAPDGAECVDALEHIK